jgi:DMSO/TMAO reductase YedYZ molybdopterin-dependent catalytic subunit
MRMSAELRLTRRQWAMGAVSAAGIVGSAAWIISNRGKAPIVLRQVSRFNDHAQAALFNPGALAPTFAPSEITTPFPFNAYYPESSAPDIDAAAWRLRLSGRVAQPRAIDLPQLLAMPHERQITQLICIEGWSAVGSWAGVPLGWLLRSVGADLHARLVGFRCADGYWTTIDMASALHPQTILATQFLDRALPAAFGAPLRLRIPTKLGFKNAKHIDEIFVSNEAPSGFWEQQGYNWFGGL